jgi:2-C-methyl-D-erythritol 4-phosphate cytidylyltransferase
MSDQTPRYSAPRFFALVPAAGSGSRLGSALPKQYLPLLGKPMIHHTLTRLAALPELERLHVVLAPDDTTWREPPELSDRLSVHRVGGATRAASVLAGLRAMAANADDWVLVHDAARPCVTHAMLRTLIDTLRDDSVGGLLAMPIADTLKREDGQGRVLRTEPREQLWAAQTPQMFRHGLLLRALEAADAGVTDEASAVEALGLSPRLVAADARNLKVTYPTDARLAELILEKLDD